MGHPQLKILSIDGGGIKGIIPCTILSYIEKNTGFSISRLFDVIVGTSTGGIIALGLSRPNGNGGNAYTADDMRDLYVQNGKHIFSKRPKDIKSWFGSLLEKGLFDEAFDVREFEQILEDKFGNTRLKESLTNVLVTTYAPQQEKPFYFSSRLAKDDNSENFLMKEIARSTSAAPTYFKPSKVQYKDNTTLAFVDGGVFANNPSVLAYGEAKEIWKEKTATKTINIPELVDKNAKAFEVVVAPDDNDLPFFMLSLGCGHCPTKIDFSKADDWRTKDWIKPLLTDVFMQSVSETNDFAMQHLLPFYKDKSPRYIRMDDLVLSEANSEMDDASDKNISDLCNIADTYVKNNAQRLDTICNILMR